VVTKSSGTAGSADVIGLPREVDVVVVGSGAAGMMAALTAAVSGARVLVLESEPVLGGTTATSGGGTWVPNHGYSTKLLWESDSAQLGSEYLMGEGRDANLDPEVIESFIANAPQMTRFMEEHTYLSWIPGAFPDYHSDIPGATSIRALFPGPFPPALLGSDADLVRPPKKSGISKMPIPFWVLSKLKGSWIAGYAMIGALVEAGLRHGVEMRTEARAVELITADGAVTGVVVDLSGRRETIVAKMGVVLASGGFEHSSELTRQFLGDQFAVLTSPVGHEGDAVHMAQSVGAELACMDEAWWSPALQVPGQVMDGVPIARLLQAERTLPHTIVVNKAGVRFANEAAPYNEFGKKMWEVDPATGTRPNKSAWMIFDEFYRRNYGFFDTDPGDPMPDYVKRANTLEELASECGIDGAALRKTVDNFNAEAVRGRDPEFARGVTKYDRFYGDYHPRLGRFALDAFAPGTAAKARRLVAKLVGPIGGAVLAFAAKRRKPEHLRRLLVPILAEVARPSLDGPIESVLGPIDSAPYYAAKIEASCLGTIGGPRTDGIGRVLQPTGEVIPGLYAAGNAAAAPTRGFYGGSGATLSLCLTFGFLAGRDAVRTAATDVVTVPPK
jgi:3-oxosteroid 1-dehydrogenase